MNVKTAVRGGSRWAKAVARGDRTDRATREHRVGICAGCEACGHQQVPEKGGWRWLTCGTFAEETESTCGCIVALSVMGLTMPAGKTRVGSERCPRGKW